ncbi:hypothetical protein CPT_Seuss112 [Caulobacter phage Seuss]|uniref:Uncharacterized protein n=1 Tax=Caulobacter phage Seuss TaxID=1675601 RepID=A0A0K1LN45_9CAUD|nr:hypothetical protein HOR08_gp112 [Caulobacter phage Seuss]AKU43638.1 hypothetical protein CPT_Seuss112 [Caulobacter phage Seuss]
MSGGPAANEQVKQALGVKPSQHWPDDKILQGILPWSQGVIRVKVAPKGWTFARCGTMHQSQSRMARRAFAICPQCDAYVCAGHIGQHLARKDHQC